MALVDFNAFGGMEGVMKQARLRDFRLASYAKNTRLWDGSLRAFRKPLLVGSCKCSNFSVNASGVVTCLPKCAAMARSPCGARARYTLSEDGYISESDRKVGIARPTETPSATLLDIERDSPDLLLFRVVCVNDSGESSPPSAVTTRVAVSYAQPIKIDWSGCLPYRVEALVTQSMTYKKDIGAPVSQWVSVGEFAAPSAIFTYEPDNWELTSDGYDSALYCDPPKLDCFLVADTGHFIGWSGSTLYVSERHDPSKFPRTSIKNLHANILEAVSARNVVYVSTDEGFFVVRIDETKDGTSISIAETYENHVAIKGTLALHNSGVMYGTKFGVGTLDEAGRQPQIISSGLLPEDAFGTSFQPTSSTVQRGIFFANTGGDSYLIDFPSTSGKSSDFGKVVMLDPMGSAFFAAPNGMLYYSDPAGVWEFDSGDRYERAIWESNEVTLPSRTSFSRYKVTGANIAGVIFTLFIDGKEVFTSTLKDDTVCTLPLCANGIKLKIRLVLPESSQEIAITGVQIATSMTELARAS